MRRTSTAAEQGAVSLPQGLLTKEKSPIPLLGVGITGRLQGRAVELAVAQRYRNTGAEPLEATYVFPVPSDAAVCGVTVRTGDRVLRGAVEERERAFEIYDEAMATGHGGVLVDQERENVFHLSVGNLLPGQEAVVEVRMAYRADLAGGAVRLLVPTTVAPRYAPATLGAGQLREIERTTPDYARDVPYGFTIAVDVEAGTALRSVESPSHPIRVSLEGSTARVELARGLERMDRDFVLLVAAQSPREPGLVAAKAHGREHLLLELVPGLPPAPGSEPRDVRFLVDCSGSMSGDSIGQARRAVELCLRALRAGDRFQVGRFGNSFKPLSPQPLTYSQDTLDETAAKVRAMEADLGGTEILPALQQIAKGVEGQADLIVLTDGEVSNEDEVISFLERQRGRLRVFAFGIGASSSEMLVKGMARATGGAAEFISRGERIEEKVLRQFARIAAPALSDVAVDWGGLEVEQAPAVVPPLFPGDAVAVAARLPEGAEVPEGAVVTISGRTRLGPISWVARAVRVAGDGAAPLWWARERIRDLEAGHGVPEGSRQQRGADRQRRAIVSLAREYGLASSETSFVAVEERAAGERAKGPAVLRRVPAMIPVGWHGMAFEVLPAIPYDAADVACCIASSRMVARDAMEIRECLDSRSDDRLFELLALQMADGSFPLSDDLKRICGLHDDLIREAGERIALARWDRFDAVLATAFALLWLRRECPDSKHVWRPAAQKAERWLSSQVGRIEGMAAFEIVTEALGG